MRPPSSLPALLLALATISGLGCGSSDEPSPEPTHSPSPSPQAEVQDGCTLAFPYRIENTGNLAGQFVMCSDGGGALRLRSVSSWVLTVRDDGSGATLTAVDAPASASFAQEMAARAVPADCPTLDACTLPPRAEVIADGTPARMVVDIDFAASAASTAAGGWASWVTSKLRTRAQSYALSVKACADAVASLSSGYTYIEDAMRQATVSGTACGGLYADVMRELDSPSSSPTQAGDDVLRLAERFGGNLKQDAGLAAAIRIAARVRK